MTSREEASTTSFKLKIMVVVLYSPETDGHDPYLGAWKLAIQILLNLIAASNMGVSRLRESMPPMS